MQRKTTITLSRYQFVELLNSYFCEPSERVPMDALIQINNGENSMDTILSGDEHTVDISWEQTI